MLLVQLKNFKVKGFDIFTENHFLVMFVMNVLLKKENDSLYHFSVVHPLLWIIKAVN